VQSRLDEVRCQLVEERAAVEEAAVEVKGLEAGAYTRPLFSSI
jgi:hypothetical protein